MKYFSLTFIRTLGVLFGFCILSLSPGRLDPTDDFSFSLPHSHRMVTFTLLSEDNVVEILTDRLDLFPVSQIPRLAKHLVQLCCRYRLDPSYILSLIEVESGFQIKAKSPLGAV